MHVFQIRGISGLFMVLLIIISALALLVALPSSFMMVLWNAIVFEAAKGPEIDFLHGFYLWGMTVGLINLIFKPEIKLQFQQVKPAASNSKKKNQPLQTKTAEPAAKTATIESASKLDNKQEQG